MTVDLFAGIPVREYAAAEAWYTTFFGGPPSFLPNDHEAVWEVAEHRYLYIDVRPKLAGNAIHTLFVDDLDTRLAALAERGITPDEVETYDGVRKMIFFDPDGNEVSLGGASTP